jgi:transcriptional regulator with XRE-family HTH domain
MASSFGSRIFLAHLELSYRLGRRVTLAQFGELIAKEMGRRPPFTAAAVSRWEKGIQVPSPEVIEAIGRLTGTDPGWLSHGEKTAAPAPRLRYQEVRSDAAGSRPASDAPRPPAEEFERLRDERRVDEREPPE